VLLFLGNSPAHGQSGCNKVFREDYVVQELDHFEDQLRLASVLPAIADVPKEDLIRGIPSWDDEIDTRRDEDRWAGLE
jgi:hypothetical protein